MAAGEISVRSEQTEQAEAGYIIEDILIDQEYVYDLSEIECGQGKTAQVERFYYPQENRAEYKVTSDWLNYTTKIQGRESEESADTLILRWIWRLRSMEKDQNHSR